MWFYFVSGILGYFLIPAYVLIPIALITSSRSVMHGKVCVKPNNMVKLAMLILYIALIHILFIVSLYILGYFFGNLSAD